MASIVGKKINGETYYYLRTMARVGGKPKMVGERYLGKSSDIEAAMAGATSVPDRTHHLAFGDVAAVWSMIGRLRISEIVDEVIGPRRADTLASVGTYIALATLNRVCTPRSKLAFARWWATVAGDHLVHLAPQATDHRRFWDAMDAISEAQLAEIERRVVAQMIETFALDLSGLVLDMTNFATYIDSANPRAPIAQRGHAKQKRTDLRLVGLGLIVARDGGIPLLSHAYPGNRPDVTQFPLMVDELVARFGALGGTDQDLTLVFDAGQDSEDNQEKVAGSPLHFVGSLPPSEHPEILAEPKSRYEIVDEEAFPGLSAFETRKVVLGAEYRLVVTHSQNLADKQRRGFAQTLAKATRQLGELEARLARGRTRKDRAGVEAEIAKILSPRWCERVISWNLAGEVPAEHRLSFAIDEDANAALEDELFGKRVLFTDRDEWIVAEVVAAYRSQSRVEADFRQMKDPKVVSFSPMFHWTEQKIRVHVFYCVLALALARLMVREATHAGAPMSVRELLSTLAGIEETVLLYPSTGGRPRARRMLTEMDQAQRGLYELFGLEAYAPRT
ncbi:MAG: IS1634 family transposase [Thermoplasmata archaeon]|nr:IS1634 family transposase [Thermoplasmata archaeon]